MINMKKITGICLLLLLTACTEHKAEFENAVYSQMESDQDIKDYNIDPDTMARCVIDLTSKKMPGVISFDPQKDPYYENYAKLILIKESEDPKKTLQELQAFFGSAGEMRKAVGNYSESIMECMTNLVNKTERSVDI